VGTLDAERVEQPACVRGVGERVAGPDLVGQPVAAPGQGEHPVPGAQVRGPLGEHVSGAAQAGQEEQRFSVAAPVEVVSAFR
jgi:hypothetical protein